MENIIKYFEDNFWKLPKEKKDELSSNLENEKWQELITKMGECKWTSIDNDCIWFGKYFLLSELPTEENTKEHTNILKDWLKEEIEKLSPYKTIF